MNRPLVGCPKCGSTNQRELAANKGLAIVFQPDGSEKRVPQTMYVLQCECGMGFTKTVWHELPAHERALPDLARAS